MDVLTTEEIAFRLLMLVIVVITSIFISIFLAITVQFLRERYHDVEIELKKIKSSLKKIQGDRGLDVSAQKDTDCNSDNDN